MKAFLKSVTAVFFIAVLFSFTAVVSSAADSCSAHNFVDDRCTNCGTYYVERGKHVKIILEEKGVRLSGVAWTVPVDAPVKVVSKGVDGFFEETTYYAIVEGIRAGESEVYAYSKGSLAQTAKVYIECKNHSFNNYVSDNNATCDDGTKTAKCEYCEVTNTIPDIGSAVHDVKSFTPNGDATCTKDGTKTGLCSKCAIFVTVTDENSKKPHDYQNYLSDGNATCTADGTKTGVCVNCGAKDTVKDEGSKTEHSFGEYVSDGNATCTEDGTKTAKCTKCDATDTTFDIFSRYGHDYSEWITITEMNCLEDGLKERVCARCGNKESEVVERTGHRLIYQPAREPTCKEEGRTSGWYCANPHCTTEYEGSTPIPKTEHRIHNSKGCASMKDNGFTMVTCSLCDEVFDSTVIYRIKSVTLSSTSYNYDGKVKTPSVLVMDVDEKALTEGEDYSLKYEGSRKAPGKYNVKIIFEGDYEGTEIRSFVIKPLKSEKIEATQTADTITLKWNKVIGATGYRVYVYNTKTGKYKTVKTTAGTTCTVKKLKSGTAYKYAVKAYTKTSDGETIWAENSVKITTATKPATLKVKVTAGSKKATLSWNEVRGATGYQVYMKAPGESYKKIKVTTDSKYTVKSLKKGKTYKFRVRAYSKVDGKYIYGDYKTYSVKIK